jgi:hypothetical protein
MTQLKAAGLNSLENVPRNCGDDQTDWLGACLG